MELNELWRCECGREVAVKLPRCPRCGRTRGGGSAQAPARASGIRPAAQATQLSSPSSSSNFPAVTEKQTVEARRILYRSPIFALGLAILAGILLNAGWPASDGSDDGSQWLLALGWLALGVAEFVMLVAVVGLGVMLGRRASPQ